MILFKNDEVIDFFNITAYRSADVVWRSWKTVDVTMHIGNDTDMGVVLHDLDPFTKYAIYVQAYSTALSKTSHTSSIVYFLTEPSGQYRPSFLLVVTDRLRYVDSVPT